VTDLFEEPVVPDASVDDSLGQTVCNWSTIDEDPDELTGGVLTAQVFSGDPVPADSQIDPDIFDEVTPIEGVGDEAFSAEDLGTSFDFLDEPVAGSLTFSELDFGDPDAPKRRSHDDIEAQFGTFHDRVT
jgi:hypothetical protein